MEDFCTIGHGVITLDNQSKVITLPIQSFAFVEDDQRIDILL